MIHVARRRYDAWMAGNPAKELWMYQSCETHTQRLTQRGTWFSCTWCISCCAAARSCAWKPSELKRFLVHSMVTAGMSEGCDPGIDLSRGCDKVPAHKHWPCESGWPSLMIDAPAIMNRIFPSLGQFSLSLSLSLSLSRARARARSWCVCARARACAQATTTTLPGSSTG